MSGREFMLTAGGLGHAPIASGTFGSTPGPALALLLVAGLTAAGRMDLAPLVVGAASLLLGLAFAIACVQFGDFAEARWGKKDPGQIVADEVAGQAIPLVGLPWAAMSGDGILRNLALAAGAFFAFRFFDILKLPPARQLESKSGGWGVLLDDLVAGVQAAVVVQIVVWLVLR